MFSVVSRTSSVVTAEREGERERGRERGREGGKEGGREREREIKRVIAVIQAFFVPRLHPLLRKWSLVKC